MFSVITKTIQEYLKDAVIRDVYAERYNSISNDSDWDEENN